ncbi:apoptosis inhibitory protein 5-domain-containing protein [Amylostereum chailletii]|nr:apoptosis inhibitory protein 5-domain-containing protein [Amylostereum chailletii]
MDSGAVEQEREIRDLIRRAERTPVPTNPLRRDALKRLIKLSRAPQASLKKLAADNISKFFKVFPDLEEDAINAIYDLCEDQDFKVRADGYKAIVIMSKQQPKWVKRNADVLVQLLQSDEQEEVTRVKRSLASHLDLNAVVTLGVLCDQIVPQDAPLDEDDKAMRDRLRMLVIAFICNDAKQSIVERHASKAGSQPENVLIEGLLKAVSKLGPSDAEKIIKDILLYLPSFQGRFTSRGNELLLVLLDRAKSSLEEDLSTGNDCTTLQRTRSFLDLALFLSVERSVSDPSHVLRFYGDSSLAKRDTQERLSKDARVFLMMFIADVWTACGDISEFGSNQMRRLISTASLTLLPVS